MKITRTSMFSGITRELELPVTEEQMDMYMNTDRHIQDIFPNLSATQREFILTGVTDEEWQNAFGDEE